MSRFTENIIQEILDWVYDLFSFEGNREIPMAGEKGPITMKMSSR